MFMALGAVAYRVGGTDLRDLRGLGKKMPLTMAALALGGLGLIGMPLTAGFVSKWYLVKGAFDAGMWGLAVVVLFGSLLALVYVWRLIEAIYFQEPEGRSAEATEAPLSMLIPIWIMAAACIWFGLNTDLTLAASMTVCSASKDAPSDATTKGSSF